MSYLLEYFSDADVFMSLPRSCTIDIGFNLLEYIDPKALWSLKRVNLYNNKLKTIPPYRPMELQMGIFFQAELESSKSINYLEHVLLCTSVINSFDDGKLCHYSLMRGLT